METWNVFDRSNDIRTTTVCESWNADWKKSVETFRPNFLKVIGKFYCEELSLHFQLGRANRGDCPHLKKDKISRTGSEILEIEIFASWGKHIRERLLGRNSAYFSSNALKDPFIQEFKLFVLLYYIQNIMFIVFCVLIFSNKIISNFEF